MVGVLVVCALSGSARATSKPRLELAQVGDVRAELSYPDPDAPAAGPSFTRLAVTRAGVPLVLTDLQSICRECTVAKVALSSATSVRVLDLDRDGEPEVMVDLYTGGAHCCVLTVFYRYVRASYVRTTHSWGNPGYRLIARLGSRPIFVTADDRFNYAFSCYACSGVPLLLQRYSSGRLVNVTRMFPGLIRADALRWWQLYRAAVHEHASPAGLLPAYPAYSAAKQFFSDLLAIFCCCNSNSSIGMQVINVFERQEAM